MWLKFIVHFLVYLICFGLMWWKLGQRPFAVVLPLASGFAFTLSAPTLVFGYFPEFEKGWIGDAMVAGTAAVIALPFSILATRMMKRQQKNNEKF